MASSHLGLPSPIPSPLCSRRIQKGSGLLWARRRTAPAWAKSIAMVLLARSECGWFVMHIPLTDARSNPNHWRCCLGGTHPSTDLKTQSRQQIPQHMLANLFYNRKKSTRETPYLKRELHMEWGSKACARVGTMSQSTSALHTSHPEPIPREMQPEEGGMAPPPYLPPSSDSMRTKRALPRTTSGRKCVWATFWSISACVKTPIQNESHTNSIYWNSIWERKEICWIKVALMRKKAVAWKFDATETTCTSG